MARIAQIVSTARHLPERVVTNADLTARFTALGKPTVIDRLAASTGITKRFDVPDDWGDVGPCPAGCQVGVASRLSGKP